MSEVIPADVKQMAQRVAEDIHAQALWGWTTVSSSQATYGLHHDNAVEIIARALMAERERAKVEAPLHLGSVVRHGHGPCAGN